VAEDSDGGIGLRIADPERLALLAHDIRASISDVIAGLRLIERDKLRPESRVQIERVSMAADQLARLLEESVAATVGERPKERYRLPPLDVPRFLRGIERRWGGIVCGLRAERGEDGGGPFFTVSAGPNLPIAAQVDRVALDRIISNFVSNALRIVPRGRIELACWLDEAQALHFRVRDDGPGFRPEQIASFAECKPATFGMGEPGSGYGMRIARDLTGRLGGRLTIANGAEGGAELTVTLPVKAWTHAGPAPVRHATPPAELPDLAGRRVLLADDTETNQLMFSQFLQKLGAEVTVVGDGGAARRELLFGSYDFAVLDVEMPVANGIEVMRDIRNAEYAERRPYLPAVAVTAYALPRNQQAILAAGFDGVLVKPVITLADFGRGLSASLARWLAPGEAAKGNPRPASGVSDADGPGALHRVSARLRHLLDESGPENEDDLRAGFVADLTSLRRRLETALEQKDRRALHAQCHTLASLAGTLGAEAIAERAATACRALEQGGGMDEGMVKDLRAISGELGPLIALVGQERGRTEDARDKARQD